MRIELELQKRYCEGENSGRTKKLIELVCKKLAKGKSPQIISEELEEDPDVIKEICRAAEPFAPDYDVEAIYETMKGSENTKSI